MNPGEIFDLAIATVTEKGLPLEVSLTEIFEEEAKGFAIFVEGKTSSSRRGDVEELRDLLRSKVGEDQRINIQFRVEAGVCEGETAPDVAAYDFSGASTTLFAGRTGKVILLDFWATWCGPCQMPMQHNQDMIVKHPEWAGKAEIVAVSIDDEDDLRKRIAEKAGHICGRVDAGAADITTCRAFRVSACGPEFVIALLSFIVV